MKAAGTNTAHSTSAIAISAPPTSSMLLIAASRGRQPRGDVALHVLHHHDGVVDHDADRQHEPEQRQIVQRESEHRHQEERPDQRYRNRDQRNDGGAPSLQEQDDHQHDQQNGLADGLLHRVDRLLDELGRVIDDGVFHPDRQARRDQLHGRADFPRGRQRVRARSLEHCERDRGIEIEIGIRGVIDRRQFDLRDVAQIDHRGLGLLDDDFAELLDIGETPLRLHGELERAGLIDRRLVQNAGGDLDVLALPAPPSRRWR